MLISPTTRAQQGGCRYSVQDKDHTGCGIWEHSNFDKNAVPKDDRPLYGMSAWTAMVFPGMHLSSGPDCGGGSRYHRNDRMHGEDTYWLLNDSMDDRSSRELTVMTTNLSVVGSGPIWAPAQGLLQKLIKFIQRSDGIHQQWVIHLSRLDNLSLVNALWMLFSLWSIDPTAWPLASHQNHC